MPVVLYTASFYDPDHWQGQPYRVSRAHPRGRRTQWLTAPFLYPPKDLLQAYRSGMLDFQGLSLEYLSAVNAAYEQSAEFQDWVSGLSSAGDVTLLCFERGDKPCHRRVAAGWLLERTPELGCGDLR